MSSLPQFLVSINGLQTHAVYNCESAISFMSLHFCSTTLSTNPSSSYSLSSSESLPFITFTILTSTGSFTSTMTMHISKDQIEDVIFGRDWFNCCSTDIPFATQSRTMDLIEPGLCLCFGTLAQACIQARVSLGQISNKLSFRKLNSGCRTMFVNRGLWFLNVGLWCPSWPWCRNFISWF